MCAFVVTNSGCAAVGVPGPMPADAHPMQCSPVRGTTEGLQIHLEPPASGVPGGVLAVFRDDAQLFAIEADPSPQGPLALLDETVRTGESYRYVCGVWVDDDAVYYDGFTVRGITPPEPPSAPALAVGPAGIEVSWPASASGTVVVYRRDVLDVGEAVRVSPALAAGPWIDGDVMGAGVYAYSLQAVERVDGVSWESGSGSEEYVEVPSDYESLPAD